MNPRNVAIIQNRFQKGGRMQVINEIVKLLNERGIVPDLICFKSNISKEEIVKAYGKEIKFNFREVFFNIRVPFEWNILLFNFIAGFYLKNYDLVINSNNTSYLLSKTLNAISYVHFPRKMRNIISIKDLHFPEGEKKSFWDYKSDLFKLTHYLYRLDSSISKKNLQIANSNFTKSILLDLYPITDDEVRVIYPPIEMNHKELNADPVKQIISLGRFSNDKRQLEQVKIAKKMPQIDFHLYGFVNSQSYFDEVSDFVNKHQLKNVHLYPDASVDQIKDGLSGSLFFIHSLRNEPFGITTVQAIQYGCIPIVHNSGGQAEIVSDKDLRYNTKEEAVNILHRLYQQDSKSLNELNEKLKVSLLKYSNEAFKQKFDQVLDLKL